jgi:hypothetical protein
VHLAVDEARTLAVADLLQRREDGCRELARPAMTSARRRR